MEDFEKTCLIGKGNVGWKHPVDVFVTIRFKEGRLSISGVEGPMSNGDCRGSCGQINMHEWDIVSYGQGWNQGVVTRLRQVWSDWHLNDMQVGSPAQMEFLKEHKNEWDRSKEEHYNWAKRVLAEVGLQPDPNYIHKGEPYSYGSAWLRKEVPEDVLQWLKDLPVSLVGLPGGWK